MNTNKPILGFSGEYHWLSNFAPCSVRYDYVLYPTVENAYVAAKTLNLDHRRIVEFCLPGQAKKYGRIFELREDWESIKVKTMRQLLVQKFSQSPYRELLICTNGQYIEETNWWHDTFWGVCEGKGKNMLGILLMDIRDDLLNSIEFH